jgi:N-acetylglucosamine-6-phosphate deacetylase
MPVTLRDGVVRDREGRLAGSALTMATAAAQYLRIVPGTDARAVARAAARNPAQLAGAADLGAIRPGALARFAVLGADGAIEPLRL